MEVLTLSMKEITVVVIYLLHCCMSVRIQENREMVCLEETFRPRCPYSQKIIVTQARYGHIEISRCVEADLGHFGCFADVKHILGGRCNQKARCEVSIPDSELSATKPCSSGLSLYLDVTYACIPDTIPLMHCNTIDVTKKVQYITSSKVRDLNCDQGQSVSLGTISFTTTENLKVKFTITKLSDSNGAYNNTFGFVSDGLANKAILMEDGQEEVEVLTQTNNVELTLTKTENVLLIAFQAFGCEDPSTPPYTWVTRDGDQATVGCENNDYTWQLSCQGTRWIGGMGNCTSAPKEVVVIPVEEKETEPPSSNSKKETWSKEILFTLVIGITLFLCVVVVTIGYVCLKRAKYEVKSTNKNNIELAGIVCDGEDTNSWSRKTFLRNGQQPPVNNQQWQQSLPKAQIIQSNGTLPANTQKYFILDRDD